MVLSLNKYEIMREILQTDCEGSASGRLSTKSSAITGNRRARLRHQPL